MSGGADIAFSDAAAQVRALATRVYSAEELMRVYLERIDRLNPRLRAIVAHEPEAALAAAHAADQQRARGDARPLLGLPIAVKDIIETADLPTTYGSRAFEGHRTGRDASVVRRLREAGAIPFAKANTLEFALSEPSPLFKDSRNPWAEGRVAGGSSNGSAVAAAAALCSAAIGTDTAGSIRNPAGYCGCVGLKPTHGLVSLEGVGELSGSMDTVGPMTRSVADAALLLGVIAGHDPDDPLSRWAPPDAGAAPQPGARLRFGVARNYFPEWISEPVEAATQAFADRLAAAGAEIVPLELPDCSAAFEIWMNLAGPEFTAWHREHPGAGQESWGRFATLVAGAFRGVSAADHALARRRAHALWRRMEAAMAGVDVLLLPTNPTLAFPFEQARTGVQSRTVLDLRSGTTGLTQPFNVTGQPGLALPIGASTEGPPHSVQLIARRFEEGRLLAAAAFAETVAGFNARPPGCA